MPCRNDWLPVTLLEVDDSGLHFYEKYLRPGRVNAKTPFCLSRLPGTSRVVATLPSVWWNLVA